MCSGVLVALGVSQRELNAVVVQADAGEDEFDQFQRAAELVLDLLRGAEEVGVVLGQSADAEHAVEFARLFVAIDGSELGQPDREVAVAARLRLVDLDVVRAVHGLEQVAFLLLLPGPQCGDFLFGRASARILGDVDRQDAGGLEEFRFVLGGQGSFLEFADPEVDELAAVVAVERGELRIAVVREMAAGFVDLHPPDVRGVDRLVTPFEQFLLDEVFEDDANGRSLGHPQAEALADFLADGEQAELLAEDAVIAAFGLVDLFEVGVLILLREPGGSVEPLELASAGISLPVGSGNRQQLEGLDPFGVRHVRAAAEIDEFALAVETDGRMAGQPSPDMFALEGLRHSLDQLQRLVPVGDETLERLRLGDDAGHFGLDSREIVLADLMRQGHVVVVALAGRRTERQFHFGKQAGDSAGHHVRTNAAVFPATAGLSRSGSGLGSAALRWPRPTDA